MQSALGHLSFDERCATQDLSQRQVPEKSLGKGEDRKADGYGGWLLFKGSGFYITDYRSAGYKKEAKEATSGGEKSSEKKKSGDGGGTAKGGEGKSGKST